MLSGTRFLTCFAIAVSTMPFCADHETGSNFVYAIFGIQYHGTHPTEPRYHLIDTFNGLIEGRTHCDRFICREHQGNATQVWLSYWKAEELVYWWSSSAVSGFWTSLPSDAGMWREFLTVEAGRTQNACSAELRNGINGLVGMKAFTEKTGYWGCLRDRIPESGPREMFRSRISEVPARVIDATKFRVGRTVITEVPENLCFLVEGQDHSFMSPEEKKHWFSEFDDLTHDWLCHLRDKPAQSGLLDVRMGHVPESGTFRDTGNPSLDHNRKIQLFFWLDMQKFERAGRVHQGHVKLRKKFMRHYSPTGPMGNGIGRMVLWEETSILRGKDVEAEYVGCREGTGFMRYDKTTLGVSRSD